MTAKQESALQKILLIVEDDVFLATCLKDELEDSGYRVLDLAVRNQTALIYAHEVRPDLALVNINLARGDDGADLARDLHALGIPVIFISGEPARARLACASAVGSMAKPYKCSDMVLAVDYLFRHALGDESVAGPINLEMY